MERVIFKTPISLALTLVIVPGLCGIARTEIQQPDSRAGRYLYVVDAGGGLTKFDTETARRVGHFDLGARTGALRIPPTSGHGAVDGCLASQALYDQAANRFYTVAAKQYRVAPDGTKDFEVLAFTIPGVQLVGHWPAGDHVEGYDPESVPRIESIVGGKPRVVAADAAPAVETKLDVVALGLSQEPLDNRIMERSGDVVLLHLLGVSGQNGIGVSAAHLRTKKLVPLPYLEGFIHLAPGGSDVVTKRSGSGEFEVYDTSSGAKVRTVNAPKGFAPDNFLAIAPTGKILSNVGGEIRIIDLGMRFANSPVVAISHKDNCSAFFFAGQ